MIADTKMNEAEALFLSALRCGIRGEKLTGCTWNEPDLTQLLRLALEHRVTALIAQAVVPDEGERGRLAPLFALGRRETVEQASHTAEFLLLLDALAAEGLHPAVMKGLICRSLYPHPEQRPSTDEDMLIRDEDFAAFHAALLRYGLTLVFPEAPTEGADEVSYWDKSKGLYIELHMRLIPPESDSYGDCNRYFADVLDHTVEVPIYGREVRTLSPTDHLLFLLCHAYKHMLHGGVGLRQICDIGLFTERFEQEIDWNRVSSVCDALGIGYLCQGFFRIAQQHLGFRCPAAFAGEEIDEMPLLLDCLRGGLYGVEDPNRQHSSTLTLEAVAAQKRGRINRGAWHSVFLPASSLANRFPYLRKRPWLLPIAWVQRVWLYLTRDRANVRDTLRQGRERIELLRQYKILR